MRGQLFVLLAALLGGFLLRLTLCGITALSKQKKRRLKKRGAVNAAKNGQASEKTIAGIGKPAVIVLDFLATFLTAASILGLTLLLNDGLLVPFTTMFFFLGLSLPSLFLQ